PPGSPRTPPPPWAPGPPRGPPLPPPPRLPGPCPHGPPEPHLDAGRARARRRSASVPRAPADAPARGVSAGLPRVPRPDAGRAGRALPPAWRLGVPPGAQRQGVGRGPAGRAHGTLARIGPGRREARAGG